MILFLLAFVQWSVFTAAETSPSEFCSGACQLLSRSVTFTADVPSSGDWLKDTCSNELEIYSVYLCLRVYCNLKEREEAISDLSERCLIREVIIPAYSNVENYTENDIQKLYHVQYDDILKEVPIILDEVAVPSGSLYQLAWRTLDAAYFESETHTSFALMMYWFWLMVICVGMSSHLGRLMVDQMTSRKFRLTSSQARVDELGRKPYRLMRVPYTWLKRYITVPATFGFTHAQAVKWCTIPTRIQSVTIGIFVALNIYLCSTSYRVFPNNIYWPKVSTQTWRYLADRTGMVSTANLALIWAFGVRNNVLLWLTGWDFAAYNNFHRWVARVATIEAIVHSVAYTVLIFKDGSFESGWTLYVWYIHQKWFLSGVLATIFMAVILGFSVYGLRRSFYEVFLIIHIVLSILVIVTMWYHVEIFHKRYYKGYIWPCVLVWLFDRAIRTLRILSFNLKFWGTKAEVTYDETSKIVRITVPYSTSFINPRAGTFYYLTSLNDGKIWESHPFTLGYSTPNFRTPRSTPAMMSPRPVELSPITQEFDWEREGQPLLDSSATISPSSMVFIVRPYNGFTGRLRDSAIYGGGSKSHRMLIDGPYGETQPFHTYTNILFVVGGTGIAVPMSYLDTILKNRTATTSVRIVWAVREHAFMTEVLSQDFRGHLEDERLEVSVWVTRADSTDKDNPFPTQKGLEIRYARPDVSAEVSQAARNSRDSSLAVVACGPGLMADLTRKAAVNALANGKSHVEYFEESFNW